MRCLILILALMATAHADTRIATIELTDGSVIRGEITALVNATYSVESETLGRIQVPQHKVSAIRYEPDRATSSAAPGSGVTDFADLQHQMVQDPGIMRSIEGLRSDPEVMALLNDPEVLRAMQSGDIQALMNDPRFLKLLNNPAVKDITSTVTGKQ